MGPQVIKDITEKIRALRDWLKTVQSRQKSYADLNRWEVEYNLGDFVFLKVSPMHGVTRFGIRGKLAPRYIGLFEVVEKVGEVVYRLNFPTKFVHVHNVFHVSMLRKYTRDLSHVIPYADIPLQADVTYKKQPKEFLAKEIRLFHNKEIPMVKVHWEKHTKEEVTTELESKMHEK